MSIFQIPRIESNLNKKKYLSTITYIICLLTKTDYIKLITLA